LSDVVQFKEGEHIPRTELSTHKNLAPVVDSKGMARYFTPQNVTFYKRKSDYTITNGERIIIRKTGYNIVASLIADESYVIQNLYQSAQVVRYSLRFLLGLLNSKFLTYYYRHILNPNTGGVFAQFRLNELNKLPIPDLDLADKNNKNLYNAFVKNVDILLQLNQELRMCFLPEQQNRLKQRIAYTEQKIDETIYALYELSEEEVKIVENSILINP
jgi:hypothetical protein